MSPPPPLDKSRLPRPSDAAAAIILVGDDGYLMQLRDDKSEIWYPNHWGLFGGAIDPGEDGPAALARELREELELMLEPARPRFFASFDFDLSPAGLASFARDFYVVPISREEHSRLVLHEGAAMRVFHGNELFREPRLTPYDSFAIYLHFVRARVG